MSSVPIRIAVGSKARVGKDAFADRVQEHLLPDAHRVAFADRLRLVCAQTQACLGVEVERDTRLMQVLGEGLKSVYGRDVWARIVMREEVPDDRPCIITDLRHKTEYAMVKAAGFVTVRINRPGRPIDRDPTHISEVDLDDEHFDYVIDNDGTLEDFHRAVDDVMEKIMATHIYTPCG